MRPFRQRRRQEPAKKENGVRRLEVATKLYKFRIKSGLRFLHQRPDEGTSWNHWGMQKLVSRDDTAILGNGVAVPGLIANRPYEGWPWRSSHYGHGGCLFQQAFPTILASHA